MDELSRQVYVLEDFVSDESFINYHFQSNKIDQQSWEEWLLKNPGKNSLAEEAKEIINELSFIISEKEYREEFQKLTEALSSVHYQPLFSTLPGGNKTFPLYKRKKKILQFLIPLLLIVIAGGYWLFGLSHTSSIKLTDTLNNSSLPLILTLSDSTIVSLAPHSHLQYPLHFGNKERNVYLHGNAKFNVKRNIEHPFKVHVENIVATVLGTIFNIKSSGDSAIIVELLKGKLNVQIINAQKEPEQSVLLNPNERAVYVRNDKHLYKNLIVPENHVSFRQSNFDEIAAQIKAVYGIILINRSSKKEWRFTGEFKNTTAKDIIENICVVKNLSFAVKEDTIVIK